MRTESAQIARSVRSGASRYRPAYRPSSSTRSSRRWRSSRNAYGPMAFCAKRVRDLEVALDAKSLALADVMRSARRHGVDGRIVAEHGWTAYRLQAADPVLHPGGGGAAGRPAGGAGAGR